MLLAPQKPLHIFELIANFPPVHLEVLIHISRDGLSGSGVRVMLKSDGLINRIDIKLPTISHDDVVLIFLWRVRDKKTYHLVSGVGLGLCRAQRAHHKHNVFC